MTSTSIGSVPVDSFEKNYWGYLEPNWHTFTRIPFGKEKREYSIGTGKGNYFVVGSEKPKWGHIDEKHCVFIWDGERRAYVKDLSTYGTYVNENKVGYNQTERLRDGNEISFGHCRYIFRLIVAGGTSPAARAKTTQASSSSSTPTHFTLPSTLAVVYRVDKALGYGTSGSVVRATHRVTGACRALKMIAFGPSSPYYENSSAAERVREEVDNLMKVEHTNICRIYASIYDVKSNILTLVLEYMEGGDLRCYINEKYIYGIPEILAKDIAYQVCDGIAHVHSKGIMHRDLKPENILLTKDSPPLVKIADFGHSKKTKPAKSNKHHSVCGSNIYIAPEVVMNGLYDDRVDCYSVGAVIYVMLTARFPYQPDMNGSSSLVKHVAERVLDLSLLRRPDISHDARYVIISLLSNFPERRLSMQGVLRSAWFDDFTPCYGKSLLLLDQSWSRPHPQTTRTERERKQTTATPSTFTSNLSHRIPDVVRLDTNWRVPPQLMPRPRPAEDSESKKHTSRSTGIEEKRNGRYYNSSAIVPPQVPLHDLGEASRRR